MCLMVIKNQDTLGLLSSKRDQILLQKVQEVISVCLVTNLVTPLGTAGTDCADYSYGFASISIFDDLQLVSGMLPRRSLDIPEMS